MENQANRTDPHRPSVIVSSDYTQIGWDYIGPRTDDIGLCFALNDERERVRELLAKNGWTHASHDHGGTCSICGAVAFYLGLFVHGPTQQVIRCGEDCANKLHLDSDGCFTHARRAIEAGIEAATGKKRAVGILNDLGLSDLADAFWATNRHGNILVTYPGGETIDSSGYDELTKQLDERFGSRAWRKVEGDFHTLNDLVRNLVKYGNWSEKQESFARSLWERVSNDPWGRLENQAAERDAERDAASPAPTGRIEVTGKVLHIREPAPDDEWPSKKFLVRTTPDGWKLWATVPSGIYDVERGDIVSFTATVKPSPDDAKFAFGSRPAKATILQQGGAA